MREVRKDTIPESSLARQFWVHAFARVPEETPNVDTLDMNREAYAINS